MVKDLKLGSVAFRIGMQFCTLSKAAPPYCSHLATYPYIRSMQCAHTCSEILLLFHSTLPTKQDPDLKSGLEKIQSPFLG